MSHVARNYAYIVKVTKPEVPEPVLSKEWLEEAERDIARYIRNDEKTEKN